MKNSFIVILSMLLFTASVNGQSKKDLELQVSQLQTELDTVKANYSSLSTVHDSTSKVLDTYISMYKTIQEKVLPYDFAPEDIGHIIDSLQTSRDSSYNSIMTGEASLRDTITLMSTSIESLNATIESQKAEIAELKAQVEKIKDPSGFTDEQVAALEKLKKLLDSEIISKEEFDAKKKLILGTE